MVSMVSTASMDAIAPLLIHSMDMIRSVQLLILRTVILSLDHATVQEDKPPDQDVLSFVSHLTP